MWLSVLCTKNQPQTRYIYIETMSSNSTTKTSLTHANAPTSTALQIQTALKHNQDLQREIAAKIHKLSLLKMRNRQKASRLIYTRTNDGDSSSTNDHSFQAKPEKFYKEFAKTLRKGLERKNTDVCGYFIFSFLFSACTS